MAAAGLRRRFSCAVAGGVLAFASASAQTAPPTLETGWAPVDKAIGETGRDAPGGVRRYAWPRTDLSVRVGRVALEPGLATVSWAAFLPSGNGDEAMTMGDLVLTEAEVSPTIGALLANGLEILAIHNHLIGESPSLVFVHFHARGEASVLARAVRSGLEKTRTPLSPAAPTPVPSPAASDAKALETIASALGHTGLVPGRVLSISIPRTERIEDGGMTVPPAMGAATGIACQASGGRVACTGDFVLLADEVNPVVRELHRHGIEVTALHSHMLREEPRLFFLHFWATGAADKVAEGLTSALAKTATRP